MSRFITGVQTAEDVQKQVESPASDAVRLRQRIFGNVTVNTILKAFMTYLQSMCFFLGPLTSCVVALQTALLMADPVMLCWAAAIRSVIDCPDIFIQ